MSETMNVLKALVCGSADTAENFRKMTGIPPKGLVMIDTAAFVIKIGDGIHTWDELPTREVTNIEVTDSVESKTGGMAASDYAAYKAFHNQFNVIDILTVSGTYTARVTGWHDMLLIGGGGGGAAGHGNATVLCGGASGQSGGYVHRFVWLEKNKEYSYIIGAGGAGGKADATTVGTSEAMVGKKGGDTSFIISYSIIIKSFGGLGGGITGAYPRYVANINSTSHTKFDKNFLNRYGQIVHVSYPGDMNPAQAIYRIPYGGGGYGGVGKKYKTQPTGGNNGTNGIYGAIIIKYHDPNIDPTISPISNVNYLDEEE